MPIALLMLAVAFFVFWFAVAGVGKILSAFYRQIYRKSAPQTLTTQDSAIQNNWRAGLGSFIWTGWVLTLAFQCVSLWWKESAIDTTLPVSFDVFWGLLALLILMLLPRLVSIFVHNSPKIPSSWLQSLIWFAPLAMTLALSYDYGTRHHLRYRASPKSINLADLRPLNTTELVALPLGGDLQPGTCQVRLRKRGDSWAQPLMTKTFSDELSGNSGGSVFVLGLQTDGPATVTQNNLGTRSMADGIDRSDFQWSFFSQNFHSKSAQLAAHQSTALANEKAGLVKILASVRDRPEPAQPILGDPDLRLVDGFRRQVDVELNRLLLQRNWDCNQGKHDKSYCVDKQTGQFCEVGRYPEAVCNEAHAKAISGRIINLSAPASSPRFAKAQSWFLWLSDKSPHPGFSPNCVIAGAEVLDAGARAPIGEAQLMCPDQGGDKASSTDMRPWIKADLPYSSAWVEQTPSDTRAELEKFVSAKGQLNQAVATATVRLKALEEAQEQLRHAQNQRSYIRLWVRTTRSKPCTPIGQEVCKSFEAVLGVKSEPVVLEEHCADEATAKRASNFNVPMFQW